MPIDPIGAAVHLLDGNEQTVAAARGDEADPVQQRSRDAISRRVEKDFAGDGGDTGIDALGVRQELPPHTRAAAVGRDQDIAARRRAVLEMSDDLIALLLVAREGLAELDVVEPGRAGLAAT